jgi:hypothetical protein
MPVENTVTRQVGSGPHGFKTLAMISLIAAAIIGLATSRPKRTTNDAVVEGLAREQGEGFVNRVGAVKLCAFAVLFEPYIQRQLPIPFHMCEGAYTEYIPSLRRTRDLNPWHCQSKTMFHERGLIRNAGPLMDRL